MGTAPILSCRRKRDDRGFWSNLPRQMEGFPWIFGIYLTHPGVAESQEEAFGVRRAKTGPRWLGGKLSVGLPRWSGPIRFVTANFACYNPLENQSLDCIWYSKQFCIDCGSSQRNGKTVYVEHFTFALSFHLLNLLLFTLLQLWLHHTRS